MLAVMAPTGNYCSSNNLSLYSIVEFVKFVPATCVHDQSNNKINFRKFQIVTAQNICSVQNEFQQTFLLMAYKTLLLASSCFRGLILTATMSRSSALVTFLEESLSELEGVVVCVVFVVIFFLGCL